MIRILSQKLLGSESSEIIISFHTPTHEIPEFPSKTLYHLVNDALSKYNINIVESRDEDYYYLTFKNILAYRNFLHSNHIPISFENLKNNNAQDEFILTFSFDYTPEDLSDEELHKIMAESLHSIGIEVIAQPDAGLFQIIFPNSDAFCCSLLFLIQELNEKI